MTEHQEQKDVSFRVSRVAHWLLNDPGFTRAMAAKELAEIARTLSPQTLVVVKHNEPKVLPHDLDPVHRIRVGPPHERTDT